MAVCSGFIYALTVADAMIQAGAATRALVVGAEIFSRILDFNDRTTCVLFGDGAGAVVLEATEHDGRAHACWPATSTPTAATPASCACRARSGGQVIGDPLLKMDGQAVFKLAVGLLETAAKAALAKAGMVEADVDWLMPHQANIRIIQSTARKLKRRMDKVIVTVASMATLGCVDPAGARASDSGASVPARPPCSRAWAAASPGARCWSALTATGCANHKTRQN